MLECLFNEVAGLKPCNFSKSGLHHMCFLVNIVQFLRTAFFIKYFGWLLLNSDSEVLVKSNVRNIYVCFPWKAIRIKWVWVNPLQLMKNCLYSNLPNITKKVSCLKSPIFFFWVIKQICEKKCVPRALQHEENINPPLNEVWNKERVCKMYHSTLICDRLSVVEFFFLIMEWYG